jgi:hypothetical protein
MPTRTRLQFVSQSHMYIQEPSTQYLTWVVQGRVSKSKDIKEPKKRSNFFNPLASKKKGSKDIKASKSKVPSVDLPYSYGSSRQLWFHEQSKASTDLDDAGSLHSEAMFPNFHERQPSFDQAVGRNSRYPSYAAVLTCQNEVPMTSSFAASMLLNISFL